MKSAVHWNILSDVPSTVVELLFAQIKVLKLMGFLITRIYILSILHQMC